MSKHVSHQLCVLCKLRKWLGAEANLLPSHFFLYLLIWIGLQRSKICMNLKLHHCFLPYSTKFLRSTIFVDFVDGLQSSGTMYLVHYYGTVCADQNLTHQGAVYRVVPSSSVLPQTCRWSACRVNSSIPQSQREGIVHKVNGWTKDWNICQHEQQSMYRITYHLPFCIVQRSLVL